MTSCILVVDDSPTIRRVVTTILERNGYEAVAASDGQDAIEVLQSGEVKADLVLLDFVMPRMNGYQFCRALRADDHLGNMPVVLMSAKSDRIRGQFVQQTGAMDAITKPFDAQALVAVVENVLKRVNDLKATGSSQRLPELAPEEPLPPPSVEFETRRTHIAHIVATKLAHIVTRTLADKPDCTPGELAAALTEKLAKDALLEMVEAVRDLERTGAGGGSILGGDLGIIPIGAVLQLLQVENQSGVLSCRSGQTEVVATFRKGLIDLVQSTGAGDEFRLGRFFVEEGILTPEQIDKMMSRVQLSDLTNVDDIETVVALDPLESTREAPSSQINLRTPGPVSTISEPKISLKSPDTVREDPGERITLPGGPESRRPSLPSSGPPTEEMDRPKRLLGATLLAFGKITESQLRSALTRQSSELLYEVLRWSKGRFDFRAGPIDAAATSAQLGLPVASVVMEGFRRVDEWRVLERTVGSFDNVLVRDEIALRQLDMGTLPSREKAVLDAVNGERSVRGILRASNLSSFDACRVLVQFLEARVLRRAS